MLPGAVTPRLLRRSHQCPVSLIDKSQSDHKYFGLGDPLSGCQQFLCPLVAPYREYCRSPNQSHVPSMLRLPVPKTHPRPKGKDEAAPFANRTPRLRSVSAAPFPLLLCFLFPSVCEQSAPSEGSRDRLVALPVTEPEDILPSFLSCPFRCAPPPRGEIFAA